MAAIVDVQRGATAHIYVLPEKVGGRATRAMHKNACYAILERHYDDLVDGCPPVAAAFLVLQEAEARNSQALRTWSDEFLKACDRSGPYPSIRGPLIASPFDFTARMITLYAVWMSGAKGATSHEIKVSWNLRTNAISGSLSLLHEAGIIRQLEEVR